MGILSPVAPRRCSCRWPSRQPCARVVGLAITPATPPIAVGMYSTDWGKSGAGALSPRAPPPTRFARRPLPRRGRPHRISRLQRNTEGTRFRSRQGTAAPCYCRYVLASPVKKLSHGEGQRKSRDLRRCSRLPEPPTVFASLTLLPLAEAWRLRQGADSTAYATGSQGRWISDPSPNV